MSWARDPFSLSPFPSGRNAENLYQSSILPLSRLDPRDDPCYYSNSQCESRNGCQMMLQRASESSTDTLQRDFRVRGKVSEEPLCRLHQRNESAEIVVVGYHSTDPAPQAILQVQLRRVTGQRYEDHLWTIIQPSPRTIGLVNARSVDIYEYEVGLRVAGQVPRSMNSCRSLLRLCVFKAMWVPPVFVFTAPKKLLLVIGRGGRPPKDTRASSATGQEV